MEPYLERYLHGEHLQVWKELVQLGVQVHQGPLSTDAYAVACETMRRVRVNVETLVDRLDRIGYRFGVWYRPVPKGAKVYGEYQPFYDIRKTRRDYDAPFSPPKPDIAERLRSAEAEMGTFPLSLRAWYENVGRIDFRGHHPDWVLYQRGAGSHWTPSTPFSNIPFHVNTDPDESPQEMRDAPERFRGWIDFCPDFYHKDGYSGGGPFYVLLPCPGADCPLYWEGREQSLLVDYLREVILIRAGFEAFDVETIRQQEKPSEQRNYDEVEEEAWRTSKQKLLEHLDFLRQDLIPF